MYEDHVFPTLQGNYFTSLPLSSNVPFPQLVTCIPLGDDVSYFTLSIDTIRRKQPHLPPTNLPVSASIGFLGFPHHKEWAALLLTTSTHG